MSFTNTDSDFSNNSNWNDAYIHGDLNSPEAVDVLSRRFSITCGFSSHNRANRWVPWSPSLKDLIEQKLSLHEVSNAKDGDAIVFAEAIVPENPKTKKLGDNVVELRGRTLDAIKAVTFAGYDIDSGESLDDVIDCLEDLGFFAIIYTTYSHGKTETSIPSKGFTAEITADAVLDEAAIRGLKNPTIMELNAKDSTGNAYALVKHDPIDKFRILFPLENSFELSPGNRAKHTELRDEWRARLLGFAKNHLKIDVDETGCDVNRLFYTPRHEEKAENWYIGVVAGRALGVDEMPLSDTYKPRQRRSTGSASSRRVASVGVTAERPELSDGFDLIKWNREFGKRFIATDFFDEVGWDIRNGNPGDDDVEIECPNDASHSDAGNPDDAACWVKNGEGDEDFVISCRHDSCHGTGKLEMLMLLEGQVALPDGCVTLSEFLCNEAFYIDAADGEPHSPVREGYLVSSVINGSHIDASASNADVSETSCVPDHKAIETACEVALQNVYSTSNYSLFNGNVCVVKGAGEDIQHVPLCDPFEVVARVYTETGDGHGIIFRFAENRAGRPLREVQVSNGDLVSDPKKVISNLVDKGLWVSATRETTNKLGELLSHMRPGKDIITASRPGWHSGVFVAPTGEVFSDSDTEYRLVDGMTLSNPKPAGTLSTWKSSISSALNCQNGDFLCVGLLSGFAGCLVSLLGEKTSPLVNFAGTTSRGKTTAQRLGASVWANPQAGGLLIKFNTTDNAIEGIAQRASGTLLALDEGGQSGMDGSRYQRAVFNLAEGSGRRRLSATGEERDVRSWVTCITISEEIGFADKVKREGRNAAAGAIARSWEVDVEDAVILGNQTIVKIDGVKQNYGQAGPEFVRHMMDRGYHSDTESLRQRVKEVELVLSPEGDSPQHRRIANTAAIFIVSGEIAQEAKLIPNDYDVMAAVKRVFERSCKRMAQDMDPNAMALSNLREKVIRRLDHDITNIDHKPDSVFREIVGWYGYSSGTRAFDGGNVTSQEIMRVYFIPVDQVHELGGGNVSATAVARALKKQGYLIPAGEKNSVWESMPGSRKIKHYRIKGAFFHGSENGDVATEV